MTSCPSARCRSTARSRAAPRSGKNATSPLEIPVWDPAVCIQCDKCVLVCPHAVIRAKVYEPARWVARRRLSNRRPRRWKEFPGSSATPSRSRPRTAPAVGCASKRARPRTRRTPAAKRSTWRRRRHCASSERANWEFFLSLPEVDRARLNLNSVKDVAAAAAAVRVFGRLCRLR